jgi:SNF2 family DNA or RNA helicase
VRRGCFYGVWAGLMLFLFFACLSQHTIDSTLTQTLLNPLRNQHHQTQKPQTEEPDGYGDDLSRATLEEDAAPLQEGRGAFDVMLTTYSMFERESAKHTNDRCAFWGGGRRAWLFVSKGRKIVSIPHKHTHVAHPQRTQTTHKTNTHQRSAFLRKWRWSQVVMDEAHALKNAASSRARRLRRVAQSARGRVMLTGTPLQNDLIELNNLLTFLLPNVFAGQGMGALLVLFLHICCFMLLALLHAPQNHHPINAL